MIYPSDLGSSFNQLALILGIAVVIPLIFDKSKPTHRVAMLSVAIVLALRYIFWRATETIAPFGLTLDWAASWALLALEALALIGSLSAFVIMMRVKSRSTEATDHANWWGPAGDPSVALLIATYNEDLDVLERTIIGAKALRHPNKEVLVLDDGRRDWLRDFCARSEVGYMRRPDNKDSKAGNINHALQRLVERDSPPDYVAVLDADFVPHRGFLRRSLALFHDPGVGLVQTPQHFFNADPIQHNLGVSQSYPDEQRFFFDHMQPSRDAWGIAFCCGTSSVIRFSALQDIGGFPTESITEDFMLTLALQNHGWRTVYLNEALTEGLAPEGLKEYVTQRARWCLGLMQIARGSLGPFARNNLRLRDRWSVMDSVFYWLTTFTFRLAALVFPLLYWYGNVTVVNAQLADVVSYFGTYYLWILLTLNLLSRGHVVPVLNDVRQLIGAYPIARSAITGLIKPYGHPFSVTAKGGDRSKIVVQWRMMLPFAVMLALTLVGLCLGVFTDRFAFFDAGDGKWVILFWTLYNIVVLSVTLVACVELPRRERHVADAPEQVRVTFGGHDLKLWMTNLTLDHARLRGRKFDVGTRGSIELAGVGSVPAYVSEKSGDGVRLQLLPDDQQRAALFLRFHAEDNTPGISNVRMSAMLRDIARRFTFSSARKS
ncbi:glycosyltransferase [Maritimibacter sp. UBA3975]|uniref:glycosyltransferase n=1 Tax=Maritimibacter sp. UBA3975 TaxID=1946833 RepID=UPI000C0BB10A|nr:glycosyltransferase [Maritimibacter sp. UBA3975]MAM63197.1 Curdlan synthase [Maritimibacter sp.]|tara:strand:- start:5879 stop:7858 length:1980 start_codon:yes stop_codon:yes gene_type:complete